jgi:3-methyladenine DNA glycosylase Tag
MNRCEWADGSELLRSYHDNEWGEPVHDDRLLFEFLILEGAQAGLSWTTVLAKREGYRKAFENFDAGKISRYSGDDVQRLLTDSRIIRNRRTGGDVVAPVASRVWSTKRNHFRKVGSQRAFLRRHKTLLSTGNPQSREITTLRTLSQKQRQSREASALSFSDYISRMSGRNPFALAGVEGLLQNGWRELPSYHKGFFPAYFL